MKFPYYCYTEHACLAYLDILILVPFDKENFMHVLSA